MSFLYMKSNILFDVPYTICRHTPKHRDLIRIASRCFPSSTIRKLTYGLKFEPQKYLHSLLYMLCCSDSPKMHYFWRICTRQHFWRVRATQVICHDFCSNQSSLINYLTLLRSQHVYLLKKGIKKKKSKPIKGRKLRKITNVLGMIEVIFHGKCSS